MSDTVLICEKNSKDRIITVNSSNELLYTVRNEKTEIIYKNVSSDFDVISEGNGNIHIVIVSLTGALLYLRYSADGWKKYTVLDSRGSGKRINGVRLLNINGRINAFYCIEYESRMMLIHHIFDAADMSREPSVVDYVGLRCAYSVCTDDSFNIHIVFSGENSRLKYMIFSNSQKRYTACDVAPDDEIRAVSCVCVGGGICTAYLSREREYNVISCFRSDTGEKHTVGFGVDAISEPCIFSDGSSVYVQWCEKGYAFECSAGGDFKFGKTQSLGQTSGILRLRSSVSSEMRLIDKCAASLVKRPMMSAKEVFDKILEGAVGGFEPVGSQVQKYARENENFIKDSFREDLYSGLEIRISDLENRLDALVKFLDSRPSDKAEERPHLDDVGETDEENVKLFNSIDVRKIGSGNAEENEYNGIEEEL